MKKLFPIIMLMLAGPCMMAQNVTGKTGTYTGARIDFKSKHHFTWTRKQDMFANYEKLSMQGSALYGGKLYQFYDKGKALLIYDATTGKLLETRPQFQYAGATETHFGSVAFSKQTEYVNARGEKVTTKTPLAYVSGHMKPKNSLEAVDDKDNYEFVDVVDTEHDYLVKRMKFRNRYDDVICAWDFAKDRGWVVGYVKNGYATDTYCITSFNMNEVDAEGYVVERDPVELPNDGTLQDCVYLNGNIYFLVGWGTNAKRQTVGKIHVYNVRTKVISATLETDISDECEGLALDEVNKRFIVTSRCIYGEDKGKGSWWDVRVK